MTGPLPDPVTGAHSLVFIGGLHRSGTTQLHATLASHPDISGMLGTSAPHDEGQHLQDVYPTARQHGGPGRFAFDADAHLTEASPLCTPEAAARLFSQWATHWDLTRPVLIEKSPPNMVRTRFLQGLFPEARFLMIVRHPIVTALATRKLATTRWMRWTFRTASLVETTRHWFAAHQFMVEDVAHVPHVHLMRWEDLCADPSRALGGIADFLGLDAHFELPDLDPHVDERYAGEWADLRNGGRYRRMSALHAVLQDNEDLAATFGYSLTDLRALGEMSV